MLKCYKYFFKIDTPLQVIISSAYKTQTKLYPSFLTLALSPLPFFFDLLNFPQFVLFFTRLFLLCKVRFETYLYDNL